MADERGPRQLLEELLNWCHDLSGTVEQDAEIEQVRAWVDGLMAANAQLREMSELQDRLLVCYRTHQRPGKWLDRLGVLRAAAATPEEGTNGAE